MKTLIKNARIISEGNILYDLNLYLSDDKITAISSDCYESDTIIV